MFWLDRGVPPQEADRMPYRRKAMLRVVLVERDQARAEKQQEEQERQDHEAHRQQVAQAHEAKMAEMGLDARGQKLR